MFEKDQLKLRWKPKIVYCYHVYNYITKLFTNQVIKPVFKTSGLLIGKKHTAAYRMPQHLQIFSQHKQAI